MPLWCQAPRDSGFFHSGSDRKEKYQVWRSDRSWFQMEMFRAGRGWRGSEQNLDSCGCETLGSSGGLCCCWPWGASPGPGEMQALLCFESVLKKDHPLRIFTKLINEPLSRLGSPLGSQAHLACVGCPVGSVFAELETSFGESSCGLLTLKALH